MRVLHVFSGFGGGISSLILNLVENREEDFIFDTLAFTYNGGEQFCKKIQDQGGNCYLMPRFKKKGFYIFLKELNDLFGCNSYDVVHCHISGWIALFFSSVAKKHGCTKFIVHAHTTRYDNYLDRLRCIQKLNQWINYRIATEYMTCSDLAAKYIFGERFLEKKQCTFIPNGIKESLFSEVLTIGEAKAYRTEFGVSNETRIVLHVGRFSPPKNHDGILAIAECINQKSKPFVFILVGDGERYDEVCQYVKEHKLGGNVLLPGRRSDISKLMQWADVMILPSHNEGLPTVAIECQASGTPIIISDMVTSQCDMGLDLVRFVDKENTEKWVQYIEEMIEKKQNVGFCVEKIRKNRFTAKEAGKLYCSTVRRIVNE